MLRFPLPLIAVAAALLLSAQPLAARPKLNTVCQVAGLSEHRLIGLGLVFGLKGTGDGEKFLPQVQATAAVLQKLYNPVKGPEDLKSAKNTALVMIHATVPRDGVYKGGRIDCTVTAVGPCTSLLGGILMSTPMGSEVLRDERALGLAAGPITLDEKSPACGRISKGVIIQTDMAPKMSDVVKNDTFRLLIKDSFVSFHSATEIASTINSSLSVEAEGQEVAVPAGPGAVDVKIPRVYSGKPYACIAQVLETGIDSPQTQARVIVNARSGIVIATADVEIGPVAFSHKNLTVRIGDPATTADTGNTPDAAAATAADPVPGVGFGVIQDAQGRVSPVRLQQLVDALNQLRVPTADVAEILKNLEKTGRLHAEVIVQE